MAKLKTLCVKFVKAGAHLAWDLSQCLIEHLGALHLIVVGIHSGLGRIKVMTYFSV